MRKLLSLITMLAIAATCAVGAEKIEAGPRKGRILKLEGVSAEFLVEKDRTISVAFYDAAKKQQEPGERVIMAFAESPAGKKKLDFERKDKFLVSKEPLPEGEGYQVVVQVRENANAKPKNFRIKLELSNCAECNHAEYACICGH